MAPLMLPVSFLAMNFDLFFVYFVLIALISFTRLPPSSFGNILCLYTAAAISFFWSSVALLQFATKLLTKSSRSLDRFGI